jgi:hypothetical protein
MLTGAVQDYKAVKSGVVKFNIGRQTDPILHRHVGGVQQRFIL